MIFQGRGLDAQLGEFLEIVQSKEVEKLLSRTIEHRASRGVPPANLAHEPPLHERFERIIALDAANRVDLGNGDRLAIGDDRQDFHQAAAQPLLLRLEESRHALGELWLGAELISTRNTNKLQRTRLAEPRAEHLKTLLYDAFRHLQS